MKEKSKVKRALFKTCAVLLVLVSGVLVFSDCHKKESLAKGQRYVVLSPEIAEIIAVLEGTQHIVGVTAECNWPESLKAKAKVGQFGAVNKEKIIALKPSIVFASSLEQQAIGSELSKLGINVVTVYPKSVEEMLQGILTVGDAIGEKNRATFAADSLRSELQKLSRNFQPNPRPKIYLEIYREPLMSVSDKSFVGELIELAGGDNIFPELERDYCRIKSEDVIKAAPDLIICYSKDTRAKIKSRMGWQNIPAVKNDRIYLEEDINPDWLLRAGPRCVLGVQRLQELMQYSVGK
ncbi:MAG TPA: helical backbone metal receptor [Candidatus Cloacimonadota bacterium]|nr:helical backbone metal receptor [Candidatus Cloacimonadota bacterium]